MKKIVIVIPIFNEENIVEELVHRLQNVTAELMYDFEFILVDDGSSDRTLEILLSLQKSEPRLTILKLSRNWGHQNAYNAGLDNAKGDAVILMDGDLEDPPELIREMIPYWEKGNEVVFGVKKSRQESSLKKFFFKSFYSIMDKVSNIRIENQAGMFALITQRVAEELKNCKEHNKYYVGLRFFLGFRQVQVFYDRAPRFSDRPKQTLQRLFRYGMDAIFSFSFIPIRILSFFGAITLLFMSLGGIIFAFARIFSTYWPFPVIPGWTTLFLVVIWTSSLQMVFLGILGEYLARIYDEVRGRPYYIIDQIIYGKRNTDSLAIEKEK